MLTIEELNSSSSTVFSNVYPSYKIHVAEESLLIALMIYIDSLTVHYFISKSIIQSNLDYPNFRTKQKCKSKYKHMAQYQCAHAQLRAVQPSFTMFVRTIVRSTKIAFKVM